MYTEMKILVSMTVILMLLVGILRIGHYCGIRFYPKGQDIATTGLEKVVVKPASFPVKFELCGASIAVLKKNKTCLLVFSNRCVLKQKLTKDVHGKKYNVTITGTPYIDIIEAYAPGAIGAIGEMEDCLSSHKSEVEDDGHKG